MCINTTVDIALLVTARPMGSAFLTTIGAGGALLDAGGTLTSAALNPIAFTISAAVGAILATLAYSAMNQTPDFQEELGDDRRIPKFFFLSTASILLGILPTLISKIISVTALFFCGSLFGGFRAGFLGMQAALQAVETYPMLTLRPQLAAEHSSMPPQTPHTPPRQQQSDLQTNPNADNMYRIIASWGTPSRRRRTESTNS